MAHRNAIFIWIMNWAVTSILTRSNEQSAPIHLYRKKSALEGARMRPSNRKSLNAKSPAAETRSTRAMRKRLCLRTSRWSQKVISLESDTSIQDYFSDSMSFLISFTSSSTPCIPSLKLFTPLPRPFISSGIFLPPKRRSTTSAIIVAIRPACDFFCG